MQCLSRLSATILILGAAGVADGARAGADETAMGRELAQRLCAQCHMNPGQGEKIGPSGIPSFKAVAMRPGQSIDGVVAWLKSRPPMMPNHHLSQDEMYRLATFILSLGEGD